MQALDFGDFSAANTGGESSVYIHGTILDIFRNRAALVAESAILLALFNL